MKRKLREIPKFTRIFFIAAVVTISSQLYFNMYSQGFRISAAVILLPILLMTVGEDLSDLTICFVTSIFVFLLRSSLLYISTGSYANAFSLYLPNMLFYICYGFIFTLLCQNKYVVSYRKMFVVVFCSDFFSNFMEILVSIPENGSEGFGDTLFYIMVIAFGRSVLAWIFLVGEKQYRTLLKKEEHENRYQRLFLMTTGLKNEIYFMKKNSEEIEHVMANAYRLYEELSTLELSDETKKLSLEIAKDVHEIKKDYISIIKGIEKEISEDYDEKQMNFSDILRILEDSTYHLLASKNINLNLQFSYTEDFVTREHYDIMGILKNLVTNAVEAVESTFEGSTITIRYEKLRGTCIFTVTDDGPGISPRHLKNIFKMGYSTKFDTITGDIYRGVGLYGVKATVEEKFGGSINVTSEQGHGTVFTVEIPAKSIMEA